MKWPECFITWSPVVRGHFDNSDWSTSPAHGCPRLARPDDLVGGGRECEWRRIDRNSDPAIGVNLQFRLITDILSIRINEHGWCLKYVWPDNFFGRRLCKEGSGHSRQADVTSEILLSGNFVQRHLLPCTKSLGITDLIVKNPNKQKSANVRFNVKPNVWYTLQSASYLT